VKTGCDLWHDLFTASERDHVHPNGPVKGLFIPSGAVIHRRAEGVKAPAPIPARDRESTAAMP